MVATFTIPVLKTLIQGSPLCLYILAQHRHQTGSPRGGFAMHRFAKCKVTKVVFGLELYWRHHQEKVMCSEREGVVGNRDQDA